MPEREQPRPEFRAAGDLSTIDGLLSELRVADAPAYRQRRAIAKATKHPIFREYVRRLGPALVERGLIGRP